MDEFVKVKLKKYISHSVCSCEDGGVRLRAEDYIEYYGHVKREFLLEEEEGVYKVVDCRRRDDPGKILGKELASLLDEGNSEMIREACFS